MITTTGDEFFLSEQEQEILCAIARAASAEMHDYVSFRLDVTAHRHTRGDLGIETDVELQWTFYTPATGHTTGNRLLSEAREQFAVLNRNTEKMLQGARELEAKAQLIRKRVAEMEGGKL